MRLILAYVFFGGLALAGLYLAIDISVTGVGPTGEPLLLTDYTNPFIKYSLPLASLFMSITSLLIPTSMHKGIIPSDYINASPFEKSRSNLILGTPFMLAMFFIYLGAFHITIVTNKARFIGLLFLSWYVYNLIGYFRHKSTI
jgi:hypothetical protein